jgi:indole-3-glycerol phosphate synthase
MADILAQIVAHKHVEVAAARRRVGLEDMRRRAFAAPSPRDFFTAVTQPQGALRVIAEVKKASPSAGVIRADFDPVAIARAYHEYGAAAISCLTDAKYFQGSLDDLTRVKVAVPLPVMRKDFLIDPYQVYEARAAGADAVLLIAECLPDEAHLQEMLGIAIELKLTVLLEVHEADSLLKVRPHLAMGQLGQTLLGINNRNLKAMTTDLGHTLQLMAMVEHRDIVVSESGIRTPQDVTRLRRAGVHRILVGEHLMRQADIGAALAELVNAPA